MAISENLSLDISRIQQISIVPTMLDVMCKTTGMGFAAIARVTEDRWIACAVQDEVAFGLEPGGELKIETTICNEIRDSREPVIIDHVEKDEQYAHHHTPRIYGLQSYISIPIIQKNGEFFGTLCAISAQPADLKNPKIMGMFNLFAELISFHLHSVDLMQESSNALRQLNKQLSNSIDENRQYQYISNHNLQEPLRKIRLFSDMLLNAVEVKDTERTKTFATRININAQRISMMIKDLSDFSELNHTEDAFEAVDLNKVISDVCAHLQSHIQVKNATVNIPVFPAISAIPAQIEQLFYHLINNALKFSRPDVSPVIMVNYQMVISEDNGRKYAEITVADNGIGIERSQLETIFNIFSQLPGRQVAEGFGIGLAHCRKIIRNHNGNISVESVPGNGTTFTILLPQVRERL